MFFRVLPLLLLASCSMAPGGDLVAPMETEQSKATYEARLQNVNFIKITPEVVRDQMAVKRQTRGNPRLAAQLRRYQYRIGVGDVLSITVWEQPELSTAANDLKSKQSPTQTGSHVSNSGTIFFPYVGEIRVAGRTVREVRRMLTSRLQEKIVSPEVNVSVVGYNSQKVYISGEVKKPGPLPVTSVPLTLVNALSAAGGVAEDAELKDVVVARNGTKRHIDLDALLHQGDQRQDLLLRDGDVVHVARNDRSRVFVMGEVVKAGVVAMKRMGLTLADALATAGGINEQQANARGIFVIRKSVDPEKMADIYQLDARNMTAMVMAADFRLKPADVIYVTAAPVAMWNRLVMQLLPTLSTINTSTSLGARFGVVN